MDELYVHADSDVTEANEGDLSTDCNCVSSAALRNCPKYLISGMAFISLLSCDLCVVFGQTQFRQAQVV